MEDMQNIIQQVILKITPSVKDKKTIRKTLSQFTTLVKNELKTKKIDAKIEVVGSIAKDTYIKNNLDIDVFLLFDPSVKRIFMAEMIRVIGKKILNNTEECYAEHPYIRGIFHDLKIELVPGYLINDARQKISAVDRTPLHTTYIQKHISKQQKQEIRLLKQFLHGINCYGAEAEIQGFSGYLCEILILKYCSFLSLLKDVRSWKLPIKISLQDNPTDNFNEHMVFIDPVDTERNVASAVSKKTLQKFIKASDAFLKEPRITFFFPNPVKLWSLSKIKSYIVQSDSQYIGIVFSKPNIIAENLIPQLRKTCKIIKKEAQNNDFKIYTIDFTINQNHQLIYIIIKADSTPLNDTYTHMGPPIKLTNHKKMFKKKWENHPLLIKEPYEKNKRLYVTLKRTYKNIIPFLINNLPSYSLGKHIEKQINNKFLILKDKDLLKKDLQMFWTTYFDGKEPWER
jgi:tRNA nucleotidyltransferase (CCA-adding enzyme)